MDEAPLTLARLYFHSGSIQFGQFKLAIHQAHPELPLSPIYLHYPTSAPGLALVPQLYDQVGQMFAQLVIERELEFDFLAGVPAGAAPLAEATHRHLSCTPDQLLTFGKDQREGENHFFLASGHPAAGATLLGIEDHTASGHNKRRFLTGVHKAKLTVHDFLTVVDRQQGGAGYLASEGITLHHLLTLEELLRLLVDDRLVDASAADSVLEYTAANQLWPESSHTT